jgi:hypothetical protein
LAVGALQLPKFISDRTFKRYQELVRTIPDKKNYSVADKYIAASALILTAMHYSKIVTEVEVAVSVRICLSGRKQHTEMTLSLIKNASKLELAHLKEHLTHYRKELNVKLDPTIKASGYIEAILRHIKAIVENPAAARLHNPDTPYPDEAVAFLHSAHSKLVEIRHLSTGISELLGSLSVNYARNAGISACAIVYAAMEGVIGRYLSVNGVFLDELASLIPKGSKYTIRERYLEMLNVVFDLAQYLTTIGKGFQSIPAWRQMSVRPPPRRHLFMALLPVVVENWRALARAKTVEQKVPIKVLGSESDGAKLWAMIFPGIELPRPKKRNYKLKTDKNDDMEGIQPNAERGKVSESTLEGPNAIELGVTNGTVPNGVKDMPAAASGQQTTNQASPPLSPPPKKPKRTRKSRAKPKATPSVPVDLMADSSPLENGANSLQVGPLITGRKRKQCLEEFPVPENEHDGLPVFGPLTYTESLEKQSLELERMAETQARHRAKRLRMYRSKKMIQVAGSSEPVSTGSPAPSDASFEAAPIRLVQPMAAVEEDEDFMLKHVEGPDTKWRERFLFNRAQYQRKRPGREPMDYRRQKPRNQAVIALLRKWQVENANRVDVDADEAELQRYTFRWQTRQLKKLLSSGIKPRDLPASVFPTSLVIARAMLMETPSARLIADEDLFQPNELEDYICSPIERILKHQQWIREGMDDVLESHLERERKRRERMQKEAVSRMEKEEEARTFQAAINRMIRMSEGGENGYDFDGMEEGSDLLDYDENGASDGTGANEESGGNANDESAANSENGAASTQNGTTTENGEQIMN